MRDGYKLDIGCYESPSHNSEAQSRTWWKSIWTMSVPPKVHIIWWRTLQNTIPTELNLREHHVPVQGICRLCCYGYDFTCHALFWCRAMKSCWKSTLFKAFLKQVKHLDIIDVFLWMKALSRKDLDNFTMRTWAVWKERMGILHNKDRICEGTETNWSISLL